MINNYNESVYIGVAAVSILLLFVKVFFFARALPLFGPFVRMIQRTIAGMRDFFLVMIIVLLGFALAFNVILNNVDGFETLTDSMLTSMMMLYGDFDKIDHPPETNSHALSLATILFNVMMVICYVTLLNLLVAILSDSYADVKAHAVQETLYQLANIIIETQQIDKGSSLKGMDLRFHKWVHVLKPADAVAIIEVDSEISKIKEKVSDLSSEITKLSEKVEAMNKNSEKQTQMIYMLQAPVPEHQDSSSKKH